MRNVKRLFNVANQAIFRTDSNLSYPRTVAAIVGLAHEIADYDDDIDWSLGEFGECTLDSLIVGAYWYFAEYHGGQGSIEYGGLSVLGNVYNPNCSSLERDSSEFDVYVALAVLGGHGDWDTIVENYDAE